MSNSITEDTVRDALRQVIDPEVGINIVDMGLIYGITINADCLTIDLTMSSPACPMGDMIMEEAEQALRTVLPATMTLHIKLVWSPPWSPERMSEKARQDFGW